MLNPLGLSGEPAACRAESFENPTRRVMFNLTQKVLFNLTLISQIEQIFLIFFRIPCYRHSGADAALLRPLKK